MANGFCRSIGTLLEAILSERIEAQSTIQEKRNLAHIIRTKVTEDFKVASGDLLDVFVKRDGEKSGKWLLSRSVLAAFDPHNCTVRFPATACRTINDVIEDITQVVSEDSFGSNVRIPND